VSAGPTGTQPPECPSVYSRVARGAIRATQTAAVGTGKLAAFTVKSLEYPFWFVGHTTVLGVKAARAENKKQAFFRIPIQLLKRDGVSMAIYASLYLVGRSTMMTLHEMDGASARDDDKDDDLIVYINGFEPGEGKDGYFYEAAESYLSYRHGENPRRIRIAPKTLEELTATLKEISSKHGKIKRLEFFGHGNEGTMFLQHAPIGESHLLDPAHKLTGVFEPGARIVLNTCWTTRGETGPKFLESLGKSYLDKGGSVHGTEVTFIGTPSLVADLAMMPFMAYKGGRDAWDYRETKPLANYLTADRLKEVKVEPRPPEMPKRLPSY
jgi:hypothetical protein